MNSAIMVAVNASAGLAGIAVTGRLSRWLPIRPHRAPLAAAIAGLGAMGADGVGLVLLAAELAAAPGGCPRSWPPQRAWPGC